jgi:PEP-CTERM motif-containing protein
LRQTVFLIALGVTSILLQPTVVRAESVGLSNASKVLSLDAFAVGSAEDSTSAPASTAAASLNAEALASLGVSGSQGLDLTIDPGNICVGTICISWPPIVITPRPVPEPATIVLLALGLGSALAFGRRRRLSATD